jgi:hypothetical protein
MEPSSQPTSPNPLREHALGMIWIGPYMIPATLVIFVALLSFTPQAAAYWLVAAAVAVVSFPFLWRHWCRPNGSLFMVIVVLVVASRSFAESALLPDITGGVSWLLLVQFLCVYVFTMFSLVRLFRHRLLESINRHSTAAGSPTWIQVGVLKIRTSKMPTFAWSRTD